MRLARRPLTRRVLGWGRGVYIVGMHRSGTSAVTRTVNLMGVPLGDLRDLIDPVPESNPTGHWESATLAGMNDHILTTLGGAWSAPPVLFAGWERGAVVAELRRDARRLFAETYASRQWVWKDPRLCLTLPFWRSCVPARAVVLLVTRHPLEVAHSLEVRNGFPVRYSLALWERYMRVALDGVAGLPVLVTAYDDLLRDAIDWCGQVSHYLSGHGFRVGKPDAGQLASFLNPGLRHTALGVEALTEHSDVTDSQCQLFQTLCMLAGTHEPMPRPDLPPEGPSTEALLSSHRALVRSTGDNWRVPIV
jgi:hypothetical protein